MVKKRRKSTDKQKKGPAKKLKGPDVVPGSGPRKPPQAPCSSQEATPAAASEPGPSTPPPAKRSKRTKAKQAAEPTQPTEGKGKGKGKAAKAKPAPQPGRWLDRDCNAALNMQRTGESRWRPLELCYWQGIRWPGGGKSYPCFTVCGASSHCQISQISQISSVSQISQISQISYISQISQISTSLASRLS
ncbi:hypothetical protein QJQ45_009057 [Haematococcus lacustris]|nr:hypothetical protein QJQ45_009057 [Haematococcus lacustris]